MQGGVGMFGHVVYCGSNPTEQIAANILGRHAAAPWMSFGHEHLRSTAWLLSNEHHALRTPITFQLGLNQRSALTEVLCFATLLKQDGGDIVDEQRAIPDELRSTYTMTRCAFPQSISQDDYLPLLAVLGEQMSFRQAAAVIALLQGKTYVQYLNDAYAALSHIGPDAAAVQQVKQVLVPCGYQAWLDKEV
jgi:hypothetical protein